VGNGAALYGGEIAATSPATTGTFNIANNSHASQVEIDGYLDDVRVWDDLRSGAEISANYDSELVGDEANLQGYWKLNNDWTDTHANSNDLTPQNSPVFQSGDLPF
jgi:hypothetical protein